MPKLNKAYQILHKNDVGGYTVPNHAVYPFQWNWDASFVAYGWLFVDEKRAWKELDMLFLGQWDNGMLPHIIFHKAAKNYFPNVDVWQVNSTPPTSGITQPPVQAALIYQMLHDAKDKQFAKAKLKEYFQPLFRMHCWWHEVRDHKKNGLVSIYHPWETGMDNSPEWDNAFQKVPMTKTPFVRKDKDCVHDDERPKDGDYKRFIHIVEQARNVDYNYKSFAPIAPFNIYHTGVNALLYFSDSHLLLMAEEFGYTEEAKQIQLWMDKSKPAILSLYHSDLKLFSSQDALSSSSINVPTSAGLLPLLLNIDDGSMLQSLREKLQQWIEQSLPSTFKESPLYEPQCYWRGPSWSIVNWLIVQACNLYHWQDESKIISQQSIKMIEDNGFWEYFNAENQIGCGGKDFSWTAAIYIILKHKGSFL